MTVSRRGTRKRTRISLLACALFALAAFAGAPSASAQTVGGPVILGGDDMTDHGFFDGTNNVDGWLYLENALRNVSPNVQRLNDNTIVALGSNNSDGSAGEAITQAAAKVGLPVRFFDGAAQIQGFFDGLASGADNPRIIWISGSDAGNNLDGCDGPGTEGQVLIDNASRINDFVNQGGGLVSHGTCYAWLQALLPAITTVDGGSSDDLYFTPEGSSAFPTLTVGDINAGPWHNHFEGDFGGLDVLVRSSNVQSPQETCVNGQVSAAGVQQCEDAAVILGGAGVSLTEKPTDLGITKQDTPDPVGLNGEITYALTVTNHGPEPATNVTITDDLPLGTTLVSTNPQQGTCTGTGPVTCNVGNLAVGASTVVALVVRASGAGTITNVARVAGGQPDPNTSNNEARADTTVSPTAGECEDQRVFRFRTHHAPGNRIKRVRVFVNDEKVLDRKSKRKDIKRFTIDRDDIPREAGQIVKIILNHSNGTRVTSVRVYGKCGKSVPTYKIKRKRKK
jgi:uncharacterized repeat protein (TIGR01451 family)